MTGCGLPVKVAHYRYLTEHSTSLTSRVWLVSFMDYDLGYFDDETCRLEPIENPFSPKLLPMSPE